MHKTSLQVGYLWQCVLHEEEHFVIKPSRLAELIAFVPLRLIWINLGFYKHNQLSLHFLEQIYKTLFPDGSRGLFCSLHGSHRRGTQEACR